jgi:hypothetical protein
MKRKIETVANVLCGISAFACLTIIIIIGLQVEQDIITIHTGLVRGAVTTAVLVVSVFVLYILEGREYEN